MPSEDRAHCARLLGYGALVDKWGCIAAVNVLLSLFAPTDEQDKAAAAHIVPTYPSQ